MESRGKESEIENKINKKKGNNSWCPLKMSTFFLNILDCSRPGNEIILFSILSKCRHFILSKCRLFSFLKMSTFVYENVDISLKIKKTLYLCR